MLIIENYKRLKGTVIGSTGYYVESIKPVEVLDSKYPILSHYYHIEITNRKQVIMVQLDRVGFLAGTDYILYELKLGQNYINMNKFQLRNMDLLIEYISKLILEQYIP